ncbi:Hypothetical protein AJAP_42770 (plasmid) [Amycolatopsis japonica]|uniref:Uncharacterized protein n=1 Tax=Amycolatopsis japonica TaxID=208439 RepID=A0A075VAF7_9PSEU|nr:hypothetical protein [Amycolatopsis japonica]AIG81321.1 Hypothetical protein AJAP_42770 [Amycolatopsis japonica]
MNRTEIPAAFRPSRTAVQVLGMNTGDAVAAIGSADTMRTIVGEMGAHFARQAAAARRGVATRARNAEAKAKAEHARVVATRCGVCFQIPAASGACWC